MTSKTLAILGIVTALGVATPAVAAAKNGADDPVTHVRKNGADDSAKARKARVARAEARRARGSDDGPNHR
jgi:hypothetical protein